MNSDDPSPRPKSDPFKYQPKSTHNGWIVGSVIVALAAFAYLYLKPSILKSLSKADLTTATSSAKYMGVALFSFEKEYGSFPNASTAAEVTSDFPTHSLDLSGNSSNAAFRQLFAGGFTDSEYIFYAKIPGITKSDDDFTPGNCLSKGENGFAYISGLSRRNSSATPIALTPLIPGTTKFDPKPFDGYAITLRIDQSVQKFKIHKDGHIYDEEGINLLSPEHPFWNGKAPDIRYPE